MTPQEVALQFIKQEGRCFAICKEMEACPFITPDGCSLSENKYVVPDVFEPDPLVVKLATKFLVERWEK